jgi:2-polyprenyl-3-methyl-5-hydroxy-6-metoxy-1,4-benzoquinol methylase
LAELPAGAVLDIGSGGGAIALAAESHGHHVFAVDRDLELLRGSGVGVPIRCDAARLPFGDGHFDAVLLIEVLEHVDDPETILREASRVARAGALLCVGVPTGYTERIYSRLHPRYMTNATHVRVFDRSSMIALLRDAGFVVERVETTNLLPATTWLVHSLLRSDSDHSGRILEHQRVSVALRKAFSLWRRTPVLRGGLRGLERRVGKSWYFYATRA